MLYEFGDYSAKPFGWVIKYWTIIGRTSFALGIIALVVYTLVASTPTILAYAGLCGIAFGAFAIFTDLIELSKKNTRS